MNIDSIECETNDSAFDSKRISTHVLLALGARWSSMPKCQGGLSVASDRDKMSVVVNGLIRSALRGGDCVGTFFLDAGAEWAPPFCPRGHAAVELRFSSNGTVSLERLAYHQSRLAQSLVGVLIEKGVWADGNVQIES